MRIMTLWFIILYLYDIKQVVFLLGPFVAKLFFLLTNYLIVIKLRHFDDHIHPVSEIFVIDYSFLYCLESCF